jgi:DNA-binding NarL/FixJ family response regulator
MTPVPDIEVEPSTAATLAGRGRFTFQLPALLVAQGQLPSSWADLEFPAAVVEVAAVHLSDAAVSSGQRAQLREQFHGLPVTDRFLRLVAERTPTHVMARELNLSERTVERRLSLLRDRLHVTRTSDVSALLVERGWLT